MFVNDKLLDTGSLLLAVGGLYIGKLNSIY